MASTHAQSARSVILVRRLTKTLWNAIQAISQTLDRQGASSVLQVLTVRMTRRAGTFSCALQVPLTLALMERAQSVLQENSVLWQSEATEPMVSTVWMEPTRKQARQSARSVLLASHALTKLPLWLAMLENIR